MATEPIQDPALHTSNGEGRNNEPKVEFTPEQQAKLQEIIDKAVGRNVAKVREEYAAQKTALETQLAEAREAAKAAKTPAAKADANDEVELLRAQIEEMKSAGRTNMNEAERWKSEAQKTQERLRAAEDAAVQIRKENAIANAAQRVGFVDVDDVVALTSKNISWDAELGTFTVVNEKGQARMNAAYEPMTLDEFYADYAAKKKHLVRTDVLFGTGSSESSRAGLSGNGKVSVTDIFGKKSDAVKANRLAKDNPAEYRRLKEVARAQGLI